MKLFFFTYAYPYGVGELWKTNELKILKHHFKQITVIPFCFGNNKIPCENIPGLQYEIPLFDDGIQFPKNYFLMLRFLFSKNIFVYTQEFFHAKVFKSKVKLKSWILASFKMYLIEKNTKFRTLLNSVDKESIIYFYWGRETSEVIPLLNMSNYKTVSRFHGYDLYKERNGGYIPYQYFQIKKMDFALPCSDFGRKTLSAYYPDLKEKIITKRLGTVGKGRTQQNTINDFTIISCAFIEKVKRIDILVEALRCVDFQIRWIHIGNGSLFEEIKILAEKLPKNVYVEFKGSIKNEEVIEFYKNNKIDLFINTSESEGVPISIMEALSASIPVLATNVGGTSEIIDDSVGKLLSKNITPQMLSSEISLFRNLSYNQKEVIKENAYNMYKTKCDANELASDFAVFLKS